VRRTVATQQNLSAELLETYASTRPAVFRIHVDPDAGERGWVGSGFFISASGYALTAFHNIPFQVREQREGHVRGRDSLGKPFLLKFIPMVGDEDHDVALLQASEGGPRAHVSLAAVRPDFSDRERIHFWAARKIQVLGFPLKDGKQVEDAISGFVSSDRPWGTVVETVNGVPTERIHITSEKTDDLHGISGGPVVDLETGLVVAVAEALERVERKLRASPVRPWPVGLQGLELPPIHVIPVRPNRTWMALVVLGLITFAAVGFLLSGLIDRAPGSNGSAPQATTTTSEPTVPPVVERVPSVPDAPHTDVRDPAPEPQPARPAPPQESACDVTVTTELPYDEFGGSHTCGFEIAGTVTPAPRPRDVIVFVTAGRDVPETRYLGRFTVGPGAKDWRVPGCKGTRYSVAVAGSGALPALDGSSSVVVPRPRQDGVSCVETFEGQR